MDVVRYDKLSLICTEKAPVEFISFTVWKCKACLDYVLFGESGFPQENFSEQVCLNYFTILEDLVNFIYMH